MAVSCCHQLLCLASDPTKSYKQPNVTTSKATYTQLVLHPGRKESIHMAEDCCSHPEVGAALQHLDEEHD